MCGAASYAGRLFVSSVRLICADAVEDSGSASAQVRILGVKGKTIIDRSAPGVSGSACVQVIANYVSLENLVCRNAYCGINLDMISMHCQVLNCEVYGCSACGIREYGTKYARIENNAVSQSGDGYAMNIMLYGCFSPPYSDACVVRNNTLMATDANGVYLFVENGPAPVLVVYNESLYLSQLKTIAGSLQKRRAKLRELQRRLRRRAQGKVTRGKPPTTATVQKQLNAILKGQHIKNLIKTHIHDKNGVITLTYRCDRAALDRLARTVLGKTILFTDNETWANHEIVLAYRGQSQIEDAFRTMKNPHFITLRPMHHWTNPMIRVHAFYCVLALTIASLLVRQLHHEGIDISIPRLFDRLNRIDEIALIWPRRPGRPSHKSPQQPPDTLTLSEMSPEQKRLFDALDLKRYAPADV